MIDAGRQAVGRKLEASLAVLNGAIGDYLARTGNGLATEMTVLARTGDGVALRMDRASLTKALTEARATGVTPR